MKQGWFYHLVFVVNIFASLALALSYGAPSLSPEDFWPASFFALGFPLVYLGNLMFGLFWLIVWDKRGFFSLGMLFLGLPFVLKFIQPIPVKSAEVEAKKELKVITFNSHFLGSYSENQNEVQDFFDFLKKENADIICLQEFSNFGTLRGSEEMPRLLEVLKDYHQVNTDPFPNMSAPGSGVCLFSKYPIVKSGIVENINPVGNLTIFADVHVGDQVIRVFNTHLKSIVFEEQDYITVSQLKETEFNRRELYGIRRIIAKLKYAFRYRARQAEAIRLKQDYCMYPMIVCGDFNDPPSSYSYKTIRGDLKDAFVEAGFGLSTTYTGKMPAFRIDYILHDPKYKTLSYTTYPFAFSDHKVVCARIKISD